MRIFVTFGFTSMNYIRLLETYEYDLESKHKKKNLDSGMIYYTLKVDIMHARWDPLDRFFNLVKVDNFCTVEHHTLTHVNCWQKIPSYALE